MKTCRLPSGLHPIFALLFLVLLVPSAVLAATIDDSLNTGVKRADKAAGQQEAIDEIDLKTKRLQREFRQVSKQVEGLEVYISQLEKQILSQEQEKGAIEASIQQVAVMQRQVTPLMLSMLQSLEEFVSLDMPFLIEEREERLARLVKMMDRGDVTVAEKYRSILEAFQTEIEYGRTIEAYRSEVKLEGEAREVDVLRIGRVALMYLTLDGNTAGAWNSETSSWEELPSSYKSRIQKGIRIARQQAAPSLIAMPVASVESSATGARQ